MTTQPHAEPHPIPPDLCPQKSQTGCGTGGSSGCPADWGVGGAQVSNSYGSTPREGNFRLTWYNLWHHDGVPTDFYGNVGVNWSMDALAYMTVNSSNELVFVWTPGRSGKALWFEPVEEGYQGKFGARQKLEEDGDIWRITEPDGTIWEFSAIDELVSKHITPGGVVTNYLKDNGRIIEKLQIMGDYAESRVFTYTDGNVSTVTLSRRSELEPYETLIRRFVFTYYTTLQSGLGSPGDLKTVTTQVRQGMSWVDAGTSYYRYYTENTSPGYKHGLKFVVGPTGYAKLVEEFTNPDTAEDDDVKDVSQQALAYEQTVSGPSTRRVSSVATHGGTQVYNIEYVEGENPEEFNSWQLKSVAEMPDDSTKTVFANHTGQDMLVDHEKEGVGRWIYYSKYNLEGRIELRAHPSAIDMNETPPHQPYNQGAADLNVQLHGAKGLIERTTYYETGDPIGYPEYQQVQKGTGGDLINLSKLDYEMETVGGINFFVVNKRTVYQSDASGGSDEVETTFENVFYSGKAQLQQVTENLPSIGSTQNGGTWLTGNTRVQQFSEGLGQLTESIDARGTVTKYEYAEATGTLSKMIQDPTGLNLITDYQVDSMGRPTKTLGPVHKVDNIDIRTVEWTVYLDDVHEVRRASGYYLVGDEEYWLVNPVTIIKSNAGGQVTDEIQAVRGSGVESSGELIGGDSFPQSSWTRWTHHTYGDNGRLLYTDVYHLIPPSGYGDLGDNYNRTEFGYDSMGRQNYVKSPGETITRTVYDPRGLVLSVSVGTDEPSMKVVTENTYDVDAYGAEDSLDGLLTKVISYVDGSNTRVVEYRYDWRDRRVESIAIESESPSVIKFTTLSTLDNLGRALKTEEFRDESGSTRIAKSKTLYDDRGQVYRTKQYAVDGAGSASMPQVSNTWYDEEGNVIKSLPAGSLSFTKNVYDAIGRQTTSYTGYYTGMDPENDDPLSLTDNLIFEQSYTGYNKVSSVLWSGTYSRYHNALTTATGALVPGTTARPDYTAYYYDGIGRSVATAQYGNQGNDGATFTRPEATPVATDSTAILLIRQTVYNARGEAEEQIIPLEEQTSPTPPTTQTTFTEYDAAGRVKLTTRNYGSSPTEVVETTYNPDSQLKKLKVFNADTGNQETIYTYGVTLAGGSEIQSNALLASVKYPDLGEVFYNYNRQGQLIWMKDQNETEHEYDYDELGRQKEDKVAALGGGVNGAVMRIAWSYDDRKRLYKVTSFNTGGDETNEVAFEYNDFNQLRFEYQQHDGEVTGGSPKVEYGYEPGNDNTIRRTSCTYPDTTVLSYNYSGTADERLSRLSGLTWNSTAVTTYEYLGLNQVVIQKYPDPSTDVEYTLAPSGTPAAYTGMDRFGRIINLLWKQSSTPLVELEYGYDLGSNRTFRRDNLGNGSGYSEAYDYDKLQRLTKLERGELNSTNSGFVGSKTLVQDWTLDSTGNWIGYDQSMTGAFDTTRTHDEANKIETITTNSSPPAWFTPPDYDANGNMTEMPDPLLVSNQLDATYDAWNRLVATNNGTNAVTYAYDGLNRRITKTMSSTVRHYYYSDRWQVLEERVGSSGSADRKYVWGQRYVDDLVLRDTSSERLYALQDALYNVVALTDNTGAVVERFAYQPYGESKALNPNYTTYTGTNYNWVYRFTGRELDTETGLQINRHRYLHHQLGRWITRDPIGYRGGPGLYAFVGTRPISNVDPLGLFPQFTHDELPPDWIYNNDIQYQFGNNLFGTPYYENLIPRITTDVWICVRPLRKAPAGGHAYLIVEGVKRGDHLWGYGGGPFTVFEGCEPKCGGGDQLRIQHGPYTSKKNAPPDDPNPSQDYPLNDEEARRHQCKKVCVNRPPAVVKECMAKVMIAIRDCCIPYKAIPGGDGSEGCNSNCVAYWMAALCFTPLCPGEDQNVNELPSHWLGPTPGWKKEIPDCVKNPPKANQ